MIRFYSGISGGLTGGAPSIYEPAARQHALAEKERRMSSERTKAGLAAAKARGKRLGGLNKAGIARRADAVAHAEALRFA